eukprot:1544227-Amphidinium_carterae.1
MAGVSHIKRPECQPPREIQEVLRVCLVARVIPRARSLVLCPLPCLQSSAPTVAPRQRGSAFVMPLT